MKKVYLILFSLIFFHSFISGQNISPLWVNRYAGPGDNGDRYNKVISDGSGGYYAVGYTVRDNNYKDYLTVKLNSNLDTVWTRTKNGSGGGDDEALAITRDPSGNIYVTGIIDGGDTRDDIYTIKYDQNGNNLWDTAYNDLDSAFLDEMPVAIALDPFGNVIVAGWTEQGNWTLNQNDYLVLKYDPAGNLILRYRFNRSGFRDEITAMAVDAAGDIFITGRCSNGTDDDWVTKKLTSAGATLWTAIYSGGNGDDRPAAIALDNTGNPIVTGRWDNGTNDDGRAIEYSSGAGTLQWNRTFSACCGHDRPNCMAIDPATGDIYIAFQGDANLTTNTDYDIFLIKLNATGIIQWPAVGWGSGALSDDIPASIALDAFGNAIICGRSDQDPAVGISNNDWITLKYDPNGVRLYEKMVNGSRNQDDEANCVVTDAAGNAIVVGFVNNTTTQKDATSRQYDAIGNPALNTHYNGQGDFNETGRAMVQDGSGNTYIAGYTFTETNDKDLFVQKINASGGLVDTLFYNGTNDDDDELEAITYNGTHLFACGYVKTDGQKSDFVTVKMQTSLDTLWIRTYNDSLNQADKAVAIAADGSGNVYVTGLSDHDPNDTTENNDIVTIKYTAGGAQQWIQRYNGASNLRDEPTKLKLGAGNRVYVCGRSENTHDDDMILLAYDQTSGAMISGFPAIFAGPTQDDDRAADMIEDAGGNIFMAGYTQSSSFVEDFALVKYNSSGVLQPGFPVFYDGPASQEDKANSLALDASGNVVITGQSDVDFDALVKNYNYTTLLYDASGNFICVDSLPFIYNGSANGDDIPVSVNVNGNQVIVTGQSEEGLSTAPNKNVMIRFYNKATCSNEAVYANYDGPAGGSESPNATLLASPAFFVTGSSDGTDGQNDVLTLKYDFPTGTDDLIYTELASFIYPNPFTQSATLFLANFPGRELSLKIYDVLGNLVKSQNGIGGSNVEIEKGNLSEGMYSYMVLDGATPVGSGRFAVSSR